MFEVTWAPPAAADDSAFVAVLCELINGAYDRAESGLWSEAIGRTSSFDVANRLRTGDVLIAEEHGRPVGSVFTRQLDDQTAWLGAQRVPLGQREPELAGFLLRDCDLAVYHKPLGT